MGKSKKGCATDLLLQKDGSDNSVEACKGWINPCEYCDKRFTKWISINEDLYDKLPEKPGFFMIGLKNKTFTEVISIFCSEFSIQQMTISEVDNIKSQISYKKTKSTKSEILVRWLISKIDEKESVILCCHWINNGILPRFVTSWPGQHLIENSELVLFSKQIQKWCYRPIDPVWRNRKPPTSKCYETVKKCNFQACEICDSYFTKWEPTSDALKRNISPSLYGLVMFSVAFGEDRETILIVNDNKSVILQIKDIIRSYSIAENYYITCSKFKTNCAHLEVRWAVIDDIHSDNACFLFAHYHNSDEWPMHNKVYRGLDIHELGEWPLLQSNRFVFLQKYKKWFYEADDFKRGRSTKIKNRRQLIEELC